MKKMRRESLKNFRKKNENFEQSHSAFGIFNIRSVAKLSHKADKSQCRKK